MSFSSESFPKKQRNKGSSTKETTSTYIKTVVGKIGAAAEKKIYYGSYTKQGSRGRDNPASSDGQVGSDGASGLESSFVCSNKVRQDRESLARKLIDPALMWEEYFSGVIIDDATDVVEACVDEKKHDFTHSQEVTQAVARGEDNFATVCHFPMKLIFTRLNRGRGIANTFASLLDFQFGPLHAALQVGDVVLEWNDSSLVIPYFCEHEDKVMEVSVQKHSKWVERTGRHYSEIKKATDELDYEGQIEQIYIVTSEKKQLIDALIEVIINYNKRNWYDVFSRNCQHFVIDALRALEVEVPAAFTGDLKGYFQALVKGRTPSIPKKFATHGDLDAYVIQLQEGNGIERVSQHDLEFLLALYFQFHLKSKKLLGKDHTALEQWKCEVEKCQMDQIERFIKKESALLHKFKVIS